MENLWNSLEIVKIAISCITPLIGGFIAWKLAKIGKDIENKQWTDRKIIEKRLEIYEKVMPDLNALYCFHLKIGNWKEITPLQVINLKRKLDKQFYIYNHLFQWDILKEYNAFMNCCFVTHTGEGENAKIKSDFEDRAQYISNWDSSWNDFFKPEEKNKEQVKKHYNRLIGIFRKELGLKLKA